MRGRLETGFTEPYYLSMKRGDGVGFTGNLMNAEKVLSPLEGFFVSAGESVALYLATPLPLPQDQHDQYGLMFGTYHFSGGMMEGYQLSQRYPALTPAISSLKHTYELLSRELLAYQEAASYLERFQHHLVRSFSTQRVILYWDSFLYEH